MLKIASTNIDVGFNFQIRNTWREKIANLLNQDEELFPFNFKVTDIIPKMKDTYYIAESIPDKKNEKVFKRTIISSSIIFISYFNNWLYR